MGGRHRHITDEEDDENLDDDDDDGDDDDVYMYSTDMHLDEQHAYRATV